MANWHDFEKDAALYFEILHQVLQVRFTDSRKAERAVKRYSHKEKYSSELKFAYGRVMVSVRY